MMDLATSPTSIGKQGYNSCKAWSIAWCNCEMIPGYLPVHSVFTSAECLATCCYYYCVAANYGILNTVYLPATLYCRAPYSGRGLLGLGISNNIAASYQGIMFKLVDFMAASVKVCYCVE